MGTPLRIIGLAHKNEDYADGERFVHRQSLLNYRINTFTLLPPTFTTAISPLGIEVLIRASPFFTVAVPSDSPSMVYTFTSCPSASHFTEMFPPLAEISTGMLSCTTLAEVAGSVVSVNMASVHTSVVAVNLFEDSGYKVGINNPYSNSETPDCPFRYKSMMLEVNKGAYMEDASLRLKHKIGNRKSIRDLITRLISELYE